MNSGGMNGPGMNVGDGPGMEEVAWEECLLIMEVWEEALILEIWEVVLFQETWEEEVQEI